MAVHVDRQMVSGSPSFHATRTEYRITETYIIHGDTSADNCQNPILARAFAGVPQYRDPNPDYADCLAIERNFDNHGPLSTKALITYSDNPDYSLEVDGDSVTTYDLMGRTETQPWDLDTIEAIGMNNEGASVYRPHCSITVSRVSSNIDASTWDVTGTINDAAWNDGTTNWAQYSLLFLGATITSEGSNWKHVYQFLYSAIDHRVTWRPYKDDPTVIANQMRRTYAAEETARVYDTGNFDLLDI